MYSETFTYMYVDSGDTENVDVALRLLRLLNTAVRTAEVHTTRQVSDHDANFIYYSEESQTLTSTVVGCRVYVLHSETRHYDKSLGLRTEAESRAGSEHKHTRNNG